MKKFILFFISFVFIFSTFKVFANECIYDSTNSRLENLIKLKTNDYVLKTKNTYNDPLLQKLALQRMVIKVEPYLKDANLLEIQRIIFKMFSCELSYQASLINQEIPLVQLDDGFVFWGYSYTNTYEFNADYINGISNYIIDYNKKQTQDNLKIKYLFIEAGAVEINNNNHPGDGIYAIYYMKESAGLKYFKMKLPNVKIFPMMGTDALSFEAIKTIDPIKIDLLINKMSYQIDTMYHIDGIHFDIEPLTLEYITLINKLAKRTNKNIGVDIAKPEEVLVLPEVEQITLMNYDLDCSVTEDYETKEDILRILGNAYDRRAKLFLDNCNNLNIKQCLLGVPVIPTNCEYDNAKVSFFEYFQEYYKRALLLKEYPGYGGISFWGLNYKNGEIPTQEIKNEIFNKAN